MRRLALHPTRLPVSYAQISEAPIRGVACLKWVIVIR